MHIIIFALLGAGIGWLAGGADELNDAVLGAVIGAGASIVLSLLIVALVFLFAFFIRD